MSNRLLSSLLFVQSLLLVGLVAERLVPAAHADAPLACQIVNWPGALTSTGFDAIRVKIDGTTSSNGLPVVIKDWDTSDMVKVGVVDWATSDTVNAAVVDWNTSDRVRVEN